MKASYGPTKAQIGPVHGNQAMQPVKAPHSTTTADPQKSVSSKQSKAKLWKSDTHQATATQWKVGY
jgi:hypothetical protein